MAVVFLVITAPPSLIFRGSVAPLAPHAAATDMSCNFGYYNVPHTVTHSLFVVLHTYRVQRKVVSLCVYKDGDWLQLDTSYYRFDSINTLVMHSAITATSIPVGDHVVLTYLRYTVHSPQYYKQRSSHRV